MDQHDTPVNGPEQDEFERHKVIIAAAVAAVCGDARITGIAEAGADRSSWARQGRVSIFSSHDVSTRRSVGRSLPDRGGRTQ